MLSNHQLRSFFGFSPVGESSLPDDANPPPCRPDSDRRGPIIGRWAGVDYGTKRIGLAVGDAETRIASPADTLQGTGRVEQDARAVADWSRQHDIHAAVVGLPLNMDGSVGPQARLIERFADALRAVTDWRVELLDERLTTYQADQHLREAGLRAARRKQHRDAMAAQIILQGFFDAM